MPMNLERFRIVVYTVLFALSAPFLMMYVRRAHDAEGWHFLPLLQVTIIAYWAARAALALFLVLAEPAEIRRGTFTAGTARRLMPKPKPTAAERALDIQLAHAWREVTRVARKNERVVEIRVQDQRAQPIAEVIHERGFRVLVSHRDWDSGHHTLEVRW